MAINQIVEVAARPQSWQELVAQSLPASQRIGCRRVIWRDACRQDSKNVARKVGRHKFEEGCGGARRWRIEVAEGRSAACRRHRLTAAADAVLDRTGKWALQDFHNWARTARTHGHTAHTAHKWALHEYSTGGVSKLNIVAMRRASVI